ncbi:MAG: DUF4091 domain-containing protein [Clostridiales bacterium]|nr:DUF4091 domain-containing protein [Clostridiales bacterium]
MEVIKIKGNNYTAKIISSLEKVFSNEEPRFKPECNRLTALKNEIVSFQVAYHSNHPRITYGSVCIESPIREYIKMRQVIEVPSSYSCHSIVDDNYLRTEPGLYPDLLRDLDDNRLIYVAGKWHSIWVDIETTEDIDAGTYPITIKFYDHEEKEVCSASTEVTIFDVALPEQKLIRTEWFHGDCLADYYNIEVFSKKHWEIIENFIATAAKYGINMILTPQFTPPLDTAVGGERTTIQLVDVEVDKDLNYSFDFSKLKRWIDICVDNNIKYIEMSHLFTQWGAQFAPKVMATVDGEYKQIFGWDTPAVGGEYTRFLEAYLPQLTHNLKKWGIAQNTYFHISDEPNVQHLESYSAAKESVAEYLRGFKVIDALSSYEFYKTGIVKKPISSNNHIHNFLDNGVENMWSYYCTSQFYNVSNRFMSMPSARNRIYGTQLYKYDIEGVLHWGYNFYNSVLSMKQINPYVVTDAMGAFPSGDPFLVYPGSDGKPEGSIRLMVHYHAMTDLRAMQLLESLTDKEYVMELIEGDLSTPITFDTYPKSDMYLINLRNKINREIAKRINA